MAKYVLRSKDGRGQLNSYLISQSLSEHEQLLRVPYFETHKRDDVQLGKWINDELARQAKPDAPASHVTVPAHRDKESRKTAAKKFGDKYGGASFTL